jgi:pRiA4b ORF-3-like protein
MDPEARAMGYPAFDEKHVRLWNFKRQPGSTFTYTYDLGDNWEHDVEIEEFVAVSDDTEPKVLAGARKCPPEDVGGVEVT